MTKRFERFVGFFIYGIAEPLPKRDDTQSAAVLHKLRNNTLLLRQRLRLELVKRIRPEVVRWAEILSDMRSKRMVLT